MKWFYNMRISMKLISCFIVVAIISGVVGVIGISNITKINNNDTILYENMTVPLSEVADMARWFQRSRVNSRDMILYDDPADIQDSYKDVMTYVANVEAIANSFEKTIIQEEVNKYFEDWKKAWAVYKEDLEILLEMCLENRDEEAFEFTRGELQDAANAVREANDKLIELKVTGARNQTESNDAAAETATVYCNFTGHIYQPDYQQSDEKSCCCGRQNCRRRSGCTYRYLYKGRNRAACQCI